MRPDPLSLSLRPEGDRQLVLERRFAAPPARVYDALTKAEIVQRWLGTADWPMTHCAVDLRVGGTFRYVWTSKDGSPMGVTGTFRALERPSRIEHVELFDEDWTDGEVPVLTELHDDGAGGTRMRMTLTYASADTRERVAATGMARGLDENYLNLDDVLAGRDGLLRVDPERDLVLERILPAPPSRVWAAWTEPAQLARWFAPAPWAVAEAHVEPYAGGIFDVRMRSPEGEVAEGDPGCVLVAVPGRMLAWTDGLGPGFTPRAESFMTAFVRLRPHPQGTRYDVLVRHADAEARAQHEGMGFTTGWGAAAEQLAELVGAPLALAD